MRGYYVHGLDFPSPFGDMKMNTPSNVYATSRSVGEWEGNEQLAADNVNRIYDAIYDAIDENYDPDNLAQIIHNVWDDWGSEEALLTISDNDIAEYVEKSI